MRHIPPARVGGLPEHLAGRAIHGHHQHLVPAGRDDRFPLIDQGTLSRVPGRNPGPVLLDQIQLPAKLAGDRIQTDDMAFRPQGHHELFRDRRHCARHPVVPLDFHRVRVPPDFFSIRQRQTAQGIRPDLRALAAVSSGIVIQQVHAAIQHGCAGMPFAHIDGPEGPGISRVPFFRQPHLFSTDAIEIRTEEPGPRAGKVCRHSVGSYQSALEWCGPGLGRSFHAGRVRARQALLPGSFGVVAVPPPQRENGQEGHDARKRPDRAE